MSPRTLLPILGIALAVLWGGIAGAEGPDWSQVAAVEEIEVLTTDEGGAARETTIWLLVLDDQGYIRTSQSTSWGGNVERDPDIALRIEGTDYPLRAVFIEDEALRERIVAAFRQKYGWTDGMMNWVRGSHPRIMRVDPRS